MELEELITNFGKFIGFLMGFGVVNFVLVAAINSIQKKKGEYKDE